MEKIAITEATQLKPSDIIKSPKGKTYRIDTYYGNKETFKVYPWPSRSGKDDFYIIVKKENLIAKAWLKSSKEDVKTAGAEDITETVDDSQNLFIKESRHNTEDNY